MSDITEATSYFDANRDNGSFCTSDPIAQQRKLLEEVGEFIEAIIVLSNEEAEMEAGDILGLIVDMLHVKGANPDITVLFRRGLDKLYSPEHTEKRRRKGLYVREHRSDQAG